MNSIALSFLVLSVSYGTRIVQRMRKICCAKENSTSQLNFFRLGRFNWPRTWGVAYTTLCSPVPGQQENGKEMIELRASTRLQVISWNFDECLIVNTSIHSSFPHFVTNLWIDSYDPMCQELRCTSELRQIFLVLLGQLSLLSRTDFFMVKTAQVFLPGRIHLMQSLAGAFRCLRRGKVARGYRRHW